MKTFIIIPAYNEEKMIGKTVEGVHKLYSNIIVIDDGSHDETAKNAEEAGAYVLRHILNRGQGAALRTGIHYALEHGADSIVTFDADGQFDPKEIEAILRPVSDGECDVALGSRFLCSNKTPFFKRIILKFATLFTRAITGLKLTDAHNGFRAFSRCAAEGINIRQDRMAHASDIIHEIARLHLKYKEVPVTIIYTEYSKQKGQRLSGAIKILFDLIIK